VIVVILAFAEGKSVLDSGNVHSFHIAEDKNLMRAPSRRVARDRWTRTQTLDRRQNDVLEELTGADSTSASLERRHRHQSMRLQVSEVVEMDQRIAYQPPEFGGLSGGKVLTVTARKG